MTVPFTHKLPKLVLFETVGVELPAGIDTLLPKAAKVTDGAVLVVKLLTTPPPLIQLEVLPLKAMLVRVPVLDPAASLNVL